MTFQVFTTKRDQLSEPVVIMAPNEIILAQLVTYFILPMDDELDVNTVFYWNLREVEDLSVADRTKRKIEQIPYTIPMGFNLRVKANTLHTNSRKRIARCEFGSVPMCFSMEEDATVGKLRDRMIDWMKQRGQGEDWMLDRPDNEVIDFDYAYPVEALVRSVPIKIFLK
jgi:hypothetical protein